MKTTKQLTIAAYGYTRGRIRTNTGRPSVNEIAFDLRKLYNQANGGRGEA